MKMYNQERKLLYIYKKKIDGIDNRNIKNFFIKTAPFEEKWQTDLCDWTKEQILQFFSEVKLRRNTQDSYMSTFREYTESMLGAKLSTHENHYYEITIKDLENTSVPEFYISRDELISITDKLINLSDAFVILGSFEGIGAYGKFMREFTYALLSDINEAEKRIYLRTTETSGRTIPISDKLIEYAKKSECVYHRSSPGKIIEYDRSQVNLIIKRGRTNSQNQHIDANLYRKLLYKITDTMEDAGFPDYVTLYDIRMSGLVNLVKCMIKEGVSKEEIFKGTVYQSKYKEEIVKIYGDQGIKNREQFWRIYGKFI